MSIKKILKNWLCGHVNKTHIRTFKQRISNHRIGDIKADLIVTVFLFECEQDGHKWPEVEIYKPEFDPFWDHEYAVKRYIDALEGQLRAHAMEYYYNDWERIPEVESV